MTDQFDPDALRKEFADYCDEVAPGIKAKAPLLNQMETLALIGMTLFQACKELKAERNQLADEVSGLRSARTAYASEFPLNADGEPDVGNVHGNIRAMKARLGLLNFIPTTAEEIIEFIGPHFNSVSPVGDDGKLTGDLENVTFSLTVHDLLSAFDWSNLGPEEIAAAKGQPT